MVQDAASDITIIALDVPTAPWAHIDAIRLLDTATGVWYSIFPEGAQGYCTKGAISWINLRLKNAGTGAGTIYLKITRQDNGATVWDNSYSLDVNGYVDIDQINFVMPAADLTLRFEIGHY